jgi:hypothetical protein
MNSRAGSVAQLLIVNLLGSVAWFPVWWYTTGFGGAVAGARRALRYRVQSYALRIWIRNFFVPMYGQYDWTGRLISVFMRFVVLVGRVIALAVEALIYGVGLVIWLLVPVVSAALLLLNVMGGVTL